LNIFSAFDGSGIAKYCFNKADIKINNYFASEIDKYPISVAMINNPDIIQIGDIKNITKSTLPKIDFIIGGSPCQGFSIAGKQLNFNDERSRLIFEYIRLVKEYKPEYFLLENVLMKKEYQDIISEMLGVNPIMINSSLVSAQNRRRLYWTNIKGINQPDDRKIYMKDIIETPGIGCLKVKGCYKIKEDKSNCIDANYFKGADNHGQRTLLIMGTAFLNGNDCLKRVYSIEGKSPTVTTGTSGNSLPKIAIDNFQYRMLTVLECERLQTWPDGYTKNVSKTQAYKMIGNGFNAETIIHQLKYI
jgi:DNA-cytosine methyltransferase